MKRIARRQFIKSSAMSAAAFVIHGCSQPFFSYRPPDFLLITADDMNWNSPGCFGSSASNPTPNIDKLAERGMRFANAHVTIAVCLPCRATLMTARYPHRSGAKGFEPIKNDVPEIQTLLQDAGYKTTVIGKTRHASAGRKLNWSTQSDFEQLGHGRNPDLYYKYTKIFLKNTENKPFFLVVNADDPHRPFHGSKQEGYHPKFKNSPRDYPPPSRVYHAGEITVPGFLPDLPDIRTETAQYYSSVRRCDDVVGKILQALEETGRRQNTFITFLSDHGMSLPFAKTNCYLNSTKTPLIVCWPGKIKPQTVETKNFISSIDFMPTILDAANLPAPSGMDGSSFLPLLLGQKKYHRDKVFTQFYKTSAQKPYPMRSVQNERFGYIFNPWSDGKTIFYNEAQNGLTWDAMVDAARTKPEVEKRVNFYKYRTLEEFYDYKKDPDALNNLIDDFRYQDKIDYLREELLRWMEKTRDPALNVFKNRYSDRHRKRFMAEQNKKS